MVSERRAPEGATDLWLKKRSAAPPGLVVSYGDVPGLTSWANVCRPSRPTERINGYFLGRSFASACGASKDIPRQRLAPVVSAGASNPMPRTEGPQARRLVRKR